MIDEYRLCSACRPQFRAFTSPSFVAHTGGEHVVIPRRVRVRLRVAQFDVGK